MSGYEEIMNLLKDGGILYANGELSTTFDYDNTYKNIIKICNRELQ